MTAKQELDARMLITYIGMAALFGRLIRADRLSADDRSLVDRAFTDLNAHLQKRGTGTYFARTSAGGYAAFEEK